MTIRSTKPSVSRRTGFAVTIAALCGLLVAKTAHGQGIYYVSNVDSTINFPLLNLDVVVNAPNSFPIILTIGAGAEISSNAYDDGYQSLEVFNNNYVDMKGGVFLAAGGRTGGITLHNTGAAGITSGSMDYLTVRDSGSFSVDGGTIGALEIQNNARGAVYSGTFSSAMAYGSSRMNIFGGAINDLFSFDSGAFNLIGTNLRLFNGEPATVQGRAGISYFLTGRLNNGDPLRTRFFREGDAQTDPVAGILFNSLPVTAVELPDGRNGICAALGAALLGASSFLGKAKRRGAHPTSANITA